MDFSLTPTFFAGAMSPDGYHSYLDKIYNPEEDSRAYLIKGGAGMGKSSFMKKIATSLMADGVSTTFITCPSDPDSLDAVIFDDINACIMDATHPHIVNPKYPEACEITVNMGDQCDFALITPKSDDIKKISKTLSGIYQRVSRYILAISALQNDSYKLALDCCDTKKAATFGAELAQRLIPSQLGRGKEQLRFLSAVTPKGLIFRSNTLKLMCDRLIAVEDEHGAVSRIVMSAIRMTALELGRDIITCVCPFAPDKKVEHIIIPELRLGFTTHNRYMRAQTDERIIHARRFENVTTIHQRRQRFAFNRRASSELIDATVNLLSHAKSVHDELEKCYIGCMDFNTVNLRAEQVEAELRSRMQK